MPQRTAEAVWSDGIRDGQGTVKLGSGTWEGEYSFRSRVRDQDRKTNPEELVSAGLASCVSMAVANRLQQRATAPEAVNTTADCYLELDRQMGPTIERVEVTTEVVSPEIDPAQVTRITTRAQQDCPVSRLLGDVDITYEVDHTR